MSKHNHKNSNITANTNINKNQEATTMTNSQNTNVTTINPVTADIAEIRQVSDEISTKARNMLVDIITDGYKIPKASAWTDYGLKGFNFVYELEKAWEEIAKAYIAKREDGKVDLNKKYDHFDRARLRVKNAYTILGIPYCDNDFIELQAAGVYTHKKVTGTNDYTTSVQSKAAVRRKFLVTITKAIKMEAATISETNRKALEGKSAKAKTTKNMTKTELLDLVARLLAEKEANASDKVSA